jgi:hypothetical protein
VEFRHYQPLSTDRFIRHCSFSFGISRTALYDGLDKKIVIVMVDTYEAGNTGTLFGILSVSGGKILINA